MKGPQWFMTGTTNYEQQVFHSYGLFCDNKDIFKSNFTLSTALWVNVLFYAKTQHISLLKECSYDNHIFLHND